MAALLHVSSHFSHDLVQRHFLIETFWNVTEGILWNQIFASQVLGELLQTLNALVIREYLVDLACVKILHSNLPFLVLEGIVIKARAGILSPLKFTHALRQLLPGRHIRCLIAN